MYFNAQHFSSKKQYRNIKQLKKHNYKKGTHKGKLLVCTLAALKMLLLFVISIQMSELVEARFCEGGHICSLPRECCTQGCCPPYQSGPRQLPPPSEHVLNLFFISHWFFWCVVVAIILAILCAYSLWKKRRTLCGWGFNEHHVQSEGDSAGSCYAPPQYSRCNSFHHPPPPYTEVTSKPDLYPLVFTCNSDNGKNGSSYLMVQYFRNYIVRPAGSLSAASTVDSLSSSFICNINEANTLVPPPYSRAASPEIGFSPHFQQQYMMPRSASQLVCQNVNSSIIMANGTSGNGQFELNGTSNANAQYNYNNGRNSHYGSSGNQVNGLTMGRLNCVGSTGNETITRYNGGDFREFEIETPFEGACISVGDTEERTIGDQVSVNVINGSNSNTDLRTLPNSTGFAQSQSDQQFRYITNSNSSMSDIFVNNSCSAGIGGNGISRQQQRSEDSLAGSLSCAGGVVHPQVGGTPVIYSNGCIKPNPLHRVNTNPTHFNLDSTTREPIFYQSNNSLGGISVTVPSGIEFDSTSVRNDNEIRDLQFLRQSLETCCQLLQQQQKLPSGNLAAEDSPLRMNEITKKYIDDGLLHSYVTSGTCSGVSSLANVGTPSSPPQATSPTGEVKEILDQIRQLQEGVSKYEEDLVFRTSTRPILHHTMSSPTPPVNKCMSPSALDSGSKLQRISTMPEQKTLAEASKTNQTAGSTITNSLANLIQSIPSASSSVVVASQSAKTTNSKSLLNSTSAGASTGFTFSSSSKRPSTLQHSKKRFYSSKPPNKALYIPMTATNHLSSNSRCTILKSPVTSVVNSNFLINRGSRQRKGWISRSAPTTPATPLPPSYLGDDSPLLNEHDEDPEGEQNAEMDN